MNQSYPCYVMFESQPGNFIQKETDNIFTIFPKFTIDLFSRMIQTLLRVDTYIEENLEVYRSIRTFSTRLGMNEDIRKRDYFERFIYLYTENGFSLKLRRDVPNETGMRLEKRGGKDGFMHYESLQAYIEAHTRVSALTFDRLDYLFRIYLTLVTATLFLNLIHYYVKKVDLVRIRIWALRVKRKFAAFIARMRSRTSVFLKKKFKLRTVVNSNSEF